MKRSGGFQKLQTSGAPGRGARRPTCQTASLDSDVRVPTRQGGRRQGRGPHLKCTDLSLESRQDVSVKMISSRKHRSAACGAEDQRVRQRAHWSPPHQVSHREVTETDIVTEVSQCPLRLAQTHRVGIRALRASLPRLQNCYVAGRGPRPDTHAGPSSGWRVQDRALPTLSPAQAQRAGEHASHFRNVVPPKQFILFSLEK